jgi:hypothetical protein
VSECRYCGNDHDVRDLCRARRVSRRTFLFASGAAAVGACLPAPPILGVVDAINTIPAPFLTTLPAWSAIDRAVYLFNRDMQLWIAS